MIPAKPLQSEADYNALGEAIVEAKTFQKWWADFMNPIIADAHKAHKTACARFKEIDEPVGQYIGQMKPYILEFQARKDAERLAEETKRTEDLAASQGSDVLPLAVTLPKITTPNGLQNRSTWRAEVKDLQKLVKAVASGKLPLTYILPNMPVLNQQAKALKNELNVPKERIPGVVAVEEQDLAVRSK